MLADNPKRRALTAPAVSHHRLRIDGNFSASAIAATATSAHAISVAAGAPIRCAIAPAARLPSGIAPNVRM